MTYDSNYNNGYLKAKTGCLTGKRAEREYATTYAISHADRSDLRGSWIFARTLGKPFNTLITLRYPSTGLDTDVEKPRYLVHKLRVYLRIVKVESHIIWSRHIEPGSGVEECMILAHLPEEFFEHFESTAQKWDKSISVERVDYGVTKEHKGSKYTVFDIMFRSVTPETMHKVPNVLSEASDPIYRPRFFNSFKLALKHRIEHRRANQQVENLN